MGYVCPCCQASRFFRLRETLPRIVTADVTERQNMNPATLAPRQLRAVTDFSELEVEESQFFSSLFQAEVPDRTLLDFLSLQPLL